MRHFEIVEQADNVRLIRIPDEFFDMENLKGDTYNAAVNNDIPEAQLRDEERAFERRVHNEGVWGYEVQRWNPDIDGGWEHVDSIWGFVGDDFHGSGYDIDLMAYLKGERV